MIWGKGEMNRNVTERHLGNMSISEEIFMGIVTIGRELLKYRIYYNRHL